MTMSIGSSSPQSDDVTTAIETDQIETVLQLLGAHIPLTLLLDLAIPVHSDEVYLEEPGVADWLISA
jgi:hypothetical protein